MNLAKLTKLVVSPSEFPAILAYGRSKLSSTIQYLEMSFEGELDLTHSTFMPNLREIIMNNGVLQHISVQKFPNLRFVQFKRILLHQSYPVSCKKMTFDVLHRSSTVCFVVTSFLPIEFCLAFNNFETVEDLLQNFFSFQSSDDLDLSDV
ncbi:hypothetical protein P9112_005453 [Eukaryota sp. TZLM1-RC]